MRASVVIHDNSGLEINNVALNSGTPFCFCLHLRMDVLWVLFFGCFLPVFATDDGIGNSTEASDKKDNIELFPPTPTYAGQTRMPRTLFKKLHSGAAFLTGLKLGAILSKKGFELGHGKIASTHSFQIFGKPVNSAMSLSYGNAGSLLPLVDDTPQPEKRTDINKEEKKIFQVTVVENSLNETEATDSQINENKKEDESVDEEPETETEFIKEHNTIVKDFNEQVLRRRNSKILIK